MRACVCMCAGLGNKAKWLFVNDRRVQQTEELEEKKKKGDEVVNYSGRWKRRRRCRRRKYQGTLRGIPPLMFLFLHLGHLGSYVTSSSSTLGVYSSPLSLRDK